MQEDTLTPRSEREVFDELAMLCATPGYAHVIAYLYLGIIPLTQVIGRCESNSRLYRRSSEGHAVPLRASTRAQ